MKKLNVLLACICISVQVAKCQNDANSLASPKKTTTNTISISPGIGIDVAARGKSVSPFGFLELQRSWGRDKLSIGIVMSGKNNITKQLEANPDTIIGGKYYLVGMSLGVKVSKKRSPKFNGTGVGGTFITVWDNFNLNPEFPFGGGPYLQFVYNLVNNDQEDEDPDQPRKTTYGVGFRSTYFIYGYQTNNIADTESKLTPGFQFRLGAMINF